MSAMEELGQPFDEQLLAVLLERNRDRACAFVGDSLTEVKEDAAGIDDGVIYCEPSRVDPRTIALVDFYPRGKQSIGEVWGPFGEQRGPFLSAIIEPGHVYEFLAKKDPDLFAGLDPQIQRHVIEDYHKFQKEVPIEQPSRDSQFVVTDVTTTADETLFNACADIHEDAFGSRTSFFEWCQLLNSQDRLAIVTKDGQLCGYALYSIFRTVRRGDLAYIAVAQAQRRHGAASALLDFVESQQPGYQLNLMQPARHKEAYFFYLKHHFQLLGDYQHVQLERR